MRTPEDIRDLAIEFGCKPFKWTDRNYPALYRCWADRIENLMNVCRNPERLAECIADADRYSGN
jgi:hypothetical protein